MSQNFNINIDNLKFIISLVVLAICFIIPFVDWFNHSDLTQMQIFIKHWWIIPVVFVVLLINKK